MPTAPSSRPLARGARRLLGSPSAAFLSFLFLASILTLGGKQLHAMSGGAPKLDFLWSAPPEAYLEALSRYGAAGRALFFRLNVVDMLFPLNVAWLGGLLLTRAFRTPGWLPLVPLAFALLDLIENLLFFRMLRAWPDFSTTLASVCAVVTTAKLAALGLSYALMLAALLRLGLRRWGSRRDGIHP